MPIIYPGSFDGLHLGHVRAISKASDYGTMYRLPLWVAVQDDRSIFDEKEHWPDVSLAERMEVIESLKGVEKAISYRDRDISNLLRHLAKRPERVVLAVSEEYGTSKYANPLPHQKVLATCEEIDITVVRIPRTPGVSSSQRRMRNAVAEFWSHAPAPNLTSFNGDPTALAEETAREVAVMLPYIRASSVVGDLGAGTGRLSVPLSKSCAKLVAVETSPEYVKALTQHGGFEVEYADVLSYLAVEIADDTYDVLVASGIITSFDDSQLTDFARGAHGALREGGYLIVRASFAKRSFSIIRQWSDDLSDFYTAHYRTVQDVVNAFYTFEVVESHDLYENNPETPVKLLVMRKT